MHVVENLILVLTLFVFTTSGESCGKETKYNDRYIDIEEFEIEEQGRAGEGKFLAHLKLNLENCTRACCENEKCNVISYDNNEQDKIKKRCYLYECVPLKDCEGNLVSKAGLETIFIDKPEQQSVNDDDSNINENAQGSNGPIYSKNRDKGVDLAVQDSDTGTASIKPTSTPPLPSSSPSSPELGVNNDSNVGPQLDSNVNSEEKPPPLSSESETGDLNNGTVDSNEQINSEESPPSSPASPSQTMSSASVAKANQKSLQSSVHTTNSSTATNTTSTSTTSSTTSTTTTTTTTTAKPQSAKQPEIENPQDTETNGTDNNDKGEISETNSPNPQVTTTTTKKPTTVAPISNSTTTSTTTTASPESVMKPTTEAKQGTTTPSTATAKTTPSTTVLQKSESNTGTETISPKENNNAEESTSAEIQHTTVLSEFLKPDNTDGPPQNQLNTSLLTTEEPQNSSTPTTSKPLTTLGTVSQTNANQISKQSNTSMESVATTSQKTTIKPITTATPSEKTTIKPVTTATPSEKTTIKPVTITTPSEKTTSVPVSTPSKETTISKVTDVMVEETTTQMALLASETEMTSTKAAEIQTVTYKPEVITSPFANSVNNTNSTQLENLLTGNKDGHPSHAWSAALIAALSFGILFFVSVLAIIAKRCFDGWQRRHYSRIDYLVNGMYG